MSTKFSIMAAVRNGYIFVIREWRYLARLAILPTGVLLITNMAIFYNQQYMTEFMYYALSLPYLTLFGWYLFMLSRLLLLGERAPFKGSTPEEMRERHHWLKVTVIVWLLWSAWWAGFKGYCTWFMQNPQLQQSGGANMFLLLLIGASFWSLRFGVVPLLASVGYSIKRYIFQVNGIRISLSLLGLSIVCLSPLFFVEAGLFTLTSPEALTIKTKPTAITVALAALLMPIELSLLAASGCYAMKEMLGRIDREKAA
ncbi:MAG: hypothetical protein ACAH80_09355 [Alphaproteobacteria bacterium]